MVSRYNDHSPDLDDETAGRIQRCYSSISGRGDRANRPALLGCELPRQTKPMSYKVIAFTMAQIRQGSLGWHRQLGNILREHPEIKVYSASPFDLDERRRMKDRFGGDIVYFFNEPACVAAEQLDLQLNFLATVNDEELPKRHTLVVGIPERTGAGASPRPD